MAGAAAAEEVVAAAAAAAAAEVAEVASASACSADEQAWPESERMRAKVRQRPSRAMRCAYHSSSVSGPTPEPSTPLKPWLTSAARKCARDTGAVGGPNAANAPPHDSQLCPPTMTGTPLHLPCRISRSG